MPETPWFHKRLPYAGLAPRRTRKAAVSPLLRGAVLSLWLVVVGCATQPVREVHQFAPIPTVSVGEQELAPVSTRPGLELLQEAEAAYANALAAKEQGDSAAAVKYYAKLQELLMAANLDPAAFASVQKELAPLLAAAGEPPPMQTSVTTGLQSGEGISPLELPFPLPPRVVAEIREIQQVYPKNFQSGLDRSQKYMPHVRSEFQKAGLPAELAWMAMVESLYTPKIVSRAGAGGMWQFMRTAANRYHLRMDSYVDERYNWKSATQAAIGYLRDLHNFFGGSWPLAVTAYNMGEGAMLRAVEANGGDRDFWRLVETPPACNRMATETKKYYPRFLAYVIVGANPERYGFRTNTHPAENTIRVPIDGMYALETLDAAMGYDPGTLAALNPDLIREATPPAGGYGIAIPADHHDKFLATLQQVPIVVATSSTHKVRRGEALSDIARQYGVSEQELAKTNHLRSSRHLKYGQVLRIPGFVMAKGGPATAAPNQETSTPAPSEKAQQAPRDYVVKRGDTLFNIAKAHDLNVEDLARWNGLDRRARLKSGIRLRLSGAETPAQSSPVTVQDAPAASPAPEETQYYIAKAGDFPAKIAQRFKIALNDFLKWNGLEKKSTIRVGQKLLVAPPEAGQRALATASAATEDRIEVIKHTVAKGDTAGKIADKYGVALKDFLRWNNLSAKSVLRIGQQLRIETKHAQVADDIPAAVLAEVPPETGATPALSPEPTLTHSVAKGETAGVIAKKYNLPLADLLVMNNLTSKSVLRVGQQLTIRPGATPTSKESSKTQKAAHPAPPAVHIVAKGETAGSIAQKYRISLADLLAMNNLTSKSVIRIGQKLTVAPTETAPDAAAPAPQDEEPDLRPATSSTHVVAKGETAGSIAQKYRISLADLLAMNNLTSKSVIRIGQKLTIAAGDVAAGASGAPATAGAGNTAETAPPEDKKVVHIVEKGNNPTLIAKRYSVKVSDLFKWNHWSGQPVLKVGDKVVIYTK